jgi:hypothetical protein
MKSPPGQSRSAPNARKVLVLAQARTVELILVTELTRWGRFAARSLTCFKFLFVSSPLLIRAMTRSPQYQKGLNHVFGDFVSKCLNGGFRSDVVSTRKGCILGGINPDISRGSRRRS